MRDRNDSCGIGRDNERERTEAMTKAKISGRMTGMARVVGDEG